MCKSNLIKLAVISAAMLGASGAYAHTRLETSTVVEGTRVHNAVNIGHGCADPTGKLAGEGALKNQPTYGTSVVFPNAITYTPIIGIDSTSDGKGTAKVYTTKPAAEFYAPLSGIGTLIRTGGPFPYTDHHLDSKGNKDGFWAGGKYYDQTVSATVQVDFYSAAVTIPAASCARSVTFELAIVDICNPNNQSPKIKDSDALFWSPIPNFTGVPGQPFGAGVADTARSIPVGPQFSLYDGFVDGDPKGKAGDGWGSPATLKVTRNLVTNPLPAGCTGNGGKGDDVYVYPEAKQINAELPIWSKSDGTGTVFWK